MAVAGVGRNNPGSKQLELFFGAVRKVYHPKWRKEKGEPTKSELEPFVADLAAAYAVLEKHLSSQPYIVGDSFTMADATVAIHTNRLLGNDGFGFAELAPAHFPNVGAWFGRLSERPAVKEHLLPNFD